MTLDQHITYLVLTFCSVFAMFPLNGARLERERERETERERQRERAGAGESFPNTHHVLPFI